MEPIIKDDSYIDNVTYTYGKSYTNIRAVNWYNSARWERVTAGLFLLQCAIVGEFNLEKAPDRPTDWDKKIGRFCAFARLPWAAHPCAIARAFLVVVRYSTSFSFSLSYFIFIFLHVA